MSTAAKAVRRILVTSVVLATGTAAHADFRLFTDQASFLAATGQSATDTYDDLPVGGVFVTHPLGPVTPFRRSIGDYQYEVLGSGRSLRYAGSSADVWLADTGPVGPGRPRLTIEGFAGAPWAIGGEFFITSSGVPVTGDAAGLLVSVSDTLGQTATFTFGQGAGFIGLVSDGAPLASFWVAPTFAVPGLPVVNNLVLAVPEASTWGQMSAGLALVASLAWRSRRRVAADARP